MGWASVRSLAERFLNIDSDLPRKRCPKCGILKPESRYYRRGRYLHSKCRRCHVAEGVAIRRRKREIGA